MCILQLCLKVSIKNIHTMKIPLAHLMLGMGIPQMCIGMYNMEMKIVEVEEGIVHHGNCEDDQTSLENIKH